MEKLNVLHVCVLCLYPNCYMCQGDYRYCYLCYGTYGVNITSRRSIPCIDTNCISCTYDAAICTNCTAGYGVTTVANALYVIQVQMHA